MRTPLNVPLLPGEQVIDAASSRVKRLRQRVLTTARLQSESLRHERSYPAMVTLTYREGAGWHGSHMSAYMHRVRQWWGRFMVRPLRYVWVAELQQRGAVHYHIVFWLPAGVTLPKSDKRGWWPHGSTRTEAARSPVAYLCKYASKVDNASGFPDGCRLHGNGGLRGEFLDMARWWALPAWARELCGVNSRARRVPGVGGFSTSCGEWFGSPWRAALSRGELVVRQVFSYLGAIKASGPYSMLGAV